MVSIYRISDFNSKYLFELVGLSTDEKPVGLFDGQPIKNGSTFLEIDTGAVFMYDQQNNIWLTI